MPPLIDWFGRRVVGKLLAVINWPSPLLGAFAIGEAHNDQQNQMPQTSWPINLYAYKTMIEIYTNSLDKIQEGSTRVVRPERLVWCESFSLQALLSGRAFFRD